MTKVDSNFRPVYLKPLTGNKFAGHLLSSTDYIDRIRVQQTDHKSTARCSEEFLDGLMSGRGPGQPGLLIGLASDCLSKKIIHWVEYVGLAQDLRDWSREFVLCSYIHAVKGNDWTPGFLIDGLREEKTNPYCFPRPQVATVARGLVHHPYQTVFLNYSHPNGTPLTGLEHFAFLTYALGYLKLSSSEMDFNCKNDLAKVFLLSMAKKLPEKEKGELKKLLLTATPQTTKTASRPISGEWRRRPTPVKT
ncbi:MAG: hypothetical protein JW873_05725 [Candidatus Saganbacteria bacterium]|nr:hypothetical protein [Candidatus Saganbacteria bacterium]